MSFREEELRENPYFVRAGSELGAIEFGMPKMFSKSATKTPVPAKAPAQAKAPASTWSMPKMFSKSPAKQPVPPTAGAPVKVVSTHATPPEFSDSKGNPLSLGDPSLAPKMLLRLDYKEPVTDLEKMMATSEKPDIMFRKLQLKYSLTPNHLTAVPCDWLYKGQPVHTCLVLKGGRLMICLASGDLKKLGGYSRFWIPFNIKDYMTNESITKAISVPLNYENALWFTKQV